MLSAIYTPKSLHSIQTTKIHLAPSNRIKENGKAYDSSLGIRRVPSPVNKLNCPEDKPHRIVYQPKIQFETKDPRNLNLTNSKTAKRQIQVTPYAKTWQTSNNIVQHHKSNFYLPKSPHHFNNAQNKYCQRTKSPQVDYRQSTSKNVKISSPTASKSSKSSQKYRQSNFQVVSESFIQKLQSPLKKPSIKLKRPIMYQSQYLLGEDSQSEQFILGNNGGSINEEIDKFFELNFASSKEKKPSKNTKKFIVSTAEETQTEVMRNIKARKQSSELRVGTGNIVTSKNLLESNAYMERSAVWLTLGAVLLITLLQLIY